MRALKVNTVLSLDGFRVCISGSAGGGRRLITQPLVQFSEGYKWQFYIKKLERFLEKAKKNQNYVYSEEFDGVSIARNQELYDVFVDKLHSSIYRCRPNNPIQTLEEGRDRFLNIDVLSQTECLLNILMVFGRMSGGCDLSSIGGSKNSAATNGFSSNVSNWGKQYKCVRIIDSSTTGLWEKKSDNLLDLL